VSGESFLTTEDQDNINIARSTGAVLAWIGGISRFAAVRLFPAHRPPFGFNDNIYQIVA